MNRLHRCFAGFLLLLATTTGSAGRLATLTWSAWHTRQPVRTRSCEPWPWQRCERPGRPGWKPSARPTRNCWKRGRHLPPERSGQTTPTGRGTGSRRRWKRWVGPGTRMPRACTGTRTWTRPRARPRLQANRFFPCAYWETWTRKRARQQPVLPDGPVREQERVDIPPGELHPPLAVGAPSASRHHRLRRWAHDRAHADGQQHSLCARRRWERGGRAARAVWARSLHAGVEAGRDDCQGSFDPAGPRRVRKGKGRRDQRGLEGRPA